MRVHLTDEIEEPSSIGLTAPGVSRGNWYYIHPARLGKDMSIGIDEDVEELYYATPYNHPLCITLPTGIKYYVCTGGYETIN